MKMLLIIILLLVCDSIGKNLNINVTEHSILEQEAAHTPLIIYGNILAREYREILQNPMSIVFILQDMQMQPTIFYRFMERVSKYFMCQNLRIILVSLTALNSEDSQSQMARYFILE